MPEGRCQSCFGERISPVPANQRSFPCLFCCWGASANKANNPDPSVSYALSLSLSACFLRTRFMVSSQGHGTTPNAAALKPVSKCKTQFTANFWAQINLDPYRRPLTLTFLLVSTRGFKLNDNNSSKVKIA